VGPLPTADARVYMSPSAVRACVEQGLETGTDAGTEAGARADVVRLALGSTTQKALDAAGLSYRPLAATGLPATLSRPRSTEPTP
jgi:uroporphyrinogen-III synthase